MKYYIITLDSELDSNGVWVRVARNPEIVDCEYAALDPLEALDGLDRVRASILSSIPVGAFSENVEPGGDR